MEIFVARKNEAQKIVAWYATSDCTLVVSESNRVENN